MNSENFSWRLRPCEGSGTKLCRWRGDDFSKRAFAEGASPKFIEFSKALLPSNNHEGFYLPSSIPPSFASDRNAITTKSCFFCLILLHGVPSSTSFPLHSPHFARQKGCSRKTTSVERSYVSLLERGYRAPQRAWYLLVFHFVCGRPSG